MKYYIILFILFSSLFSYTQNLVVNPSLENKVKNYPYLNGTSLNYCEGWAHHFTVDYYYNKPEKAKTGNCYARIFIGNNRKNFEREYLIGQLKTPLFRDSLYEISLFVNYQKDYKCELRNVEVIVSSDSIQSIFKGDFEIISLIPSKTKEKKTEWKKQSVIYTANGLEDKIFIGYFSDAIGFNNKRKCNYGSAMMVDDVSVTPLFETPEIIANTENSDFKPLMKPTLTKQPVPIQVFFDFDSYIIKSNQNIKLDSLVNQLHNNNKLFIELNGSSDLSGSFNYNRTLSKERVNSVIKYLVNNGIDKKRIIDVNYKPFDAKLPPNKLRRVDVYLLIEK